FSVPSYYFPAHSRATLFPYTTLFRSVRDDGVRDDADILPVLIRLRPVDRLDRVQLRFPIFGVRLHQVGAGRTERAEHDGMRADADRKSTRLNSSHEWISYAVFCLKKK